MNYKIDTQTPFEVRSDFTKAFDFISEKLPIVFTEASDYDVYFDFVDTPLNGGRWIGDVVRDDQNPNALKVRLSIDQAIKDSGYLWNLIAHEIMHCLTKLINKTGKAFITDEMDYTFVNGVGIPYYKNWEPYAPDGNFSVMFKKLKPHLHLIAKPSMPVVTIKRTKDTGKQTLGELSTDGFSCKTIELAWKNNQSNVSCIPKGEYDVEWSFSPSRLKYTYRLKNVPGRSGILIHGGNYFFNYKGCIGLGTGYAHINKDGEIDLLNTNATVKKFEDHLGRKPFKLLVK